MNVCELNYFTQRKWRIIPSTMGPDPENENHILRIFHLHENWVAIVCTTDSAKHNPYIGQYNPKEGRIEDFSGSAWMIECKPGIPNKIVYSSMLAPGSWTAEDAGDTL